MLHITHCHFLFLPFKAIGFLKVGAVSWNIAQSLVHFRGSTNVNGLIAFSLGISYMCKETWQILYLFCLNKKKKTKLWYNVTQSLESDYLESNSNWLWKDHSCSFNHFLQIQIIFPTELGCNDDLIRYTILKYIIDLYREGD